MWVDVVWIVMIVAAGLLVAMTLTDILYERRIKHTLEDTDAKLCEIDIWVIDSTVDFLAKTIDNYPLKEGETKQEALFSQAQRITRDRLLKAGLKINEHNDPLIDDRIIQRIEEIGI